jgi:hypothetical protein
VREAPSAAGVARLLALANGSTSEGRDIDRDKVRDKLVAVLVLLYDGKVRAARLVLQSVIGTLADDEGTAATAA